MARILLTFAVLIVSLTAPGMSQTPVVVELFTSEGCSSCPPADAVLTELSRQPLQDGVQLVLLGEHVDYWNYIGWTDRFSSKQFSQRQNDYARALPSSVYTPQMVIDGEDSFVGNNAAEVRSRIAASAKKPKPAQVLLAWREKGKLHITIHSAAAGKANVVLAITEDGLSTDVAKGENGGKVLHHAAVVRQLRSVATIGQGDFENTIDVSRQVEWNAANIKIAVLVQDEKSLRVLGAAQIPFSP